MISGFRFLLIVLFLLVFSSTSAAGPNKKVEDWYVYCDDVLQCTMQTNNESEIYAFGFIRSPKANSEAVLFLSTSLELVRGSRIIAIFDGNDSNWFRIETDTATQEQGVWRFPGQNQNNEILNAMMAGKSVVLQFDTKNGLREVPISLSGMARSALFVDEAQDRVGNRDALQAKGEGEPKDVKTRVTVLKSSGDLPVEVLDFWKNNTGRCGEGRDDQGDFIKSFRGISVALENNGQLIVLPCGLPGAYNLSQTVLAFDGETKKVRTVALPVMGDRGPTTIDYAFNTDWNDRESTLTAFYKGRGLGDCGTRTVWYWEGGYYSNFQLLEEYAKDDCDGNRDDWPRVWPPQ